jgi:dTDP-4-dehydrorhamnose reductase
MRWMVTGGRGMLASDLVAALRAAGEDVVALARTDLDVTSSAACDEVLADADIVVNAAAWTAVDAAEAHERDAFAINAVGTANVARASRRAGFGLIHLSTDYVFAGDASTPYEENAPVSPRSAYGRSKAAGEWAARAESPNSYVVRTAWLYGEHGPNFVKTMARLARDRETVAVVTDQRGQPTWTQDVAAAILTLVRSKAPPGVYHATSSGETTWFDFTRALFEELGLDPARVVPTTTDAFPRPAPRPAYSVLGHQAWSDVGIPAIRDWRAALAAAATRVAADA